MYNSLALGIILQLTLMSLIFRDFDLNSEKDYLLGRYLERKRKYSCCGINKNKQNRIFWFSDFKNEIFLFVLILLELAFYFKIYFMIISLFHSFQFIIFIWFSNCFLCRPLNSFLRNRNIWFYHATLTGAPKYDVIIFGLIFKKLSRCKSLPKPNFK